MAKLLEGIKVLDFTNNVAGPATAVALADYGAEVIHIEKPVWGDDCRNYIPMADGISAMHMMINRSKKSMVMDLKDSDAIAVLKRMVADTDVIVESFRPGVMDRLGLGYEELSEINPRLIYCSISAFGQKGPYATRAGYDVIAQAFSGFIYYTGGESGTPTKICGAIGDYSSALNAYGQIMTALYYRERTGRGQHIDVSLARTLLWMNAYFDHIYTGEPRPRSGNHDYTLSPYGVFERSPEEYLVIGAVNVSTWKKLCEAMERPDLVTDPRYLTNDARVHHDDEVIAIIEDWLRSLPSVDEAARILDEAGVPNCKLNTMTDILEDPHVVENGWVTDIPPCTGVTSIPAAKAVVGLADFSGGEPVVGGAEALGESSVEILTKYGLSPEEAQKLEQRWSGK